ncbi:multidrug export mepA domain protein, partial [Vibrio parahaemolyticus V-223/04]
APSQNLAFKAQL